MNYHKNIIILYTICAFGFQIRVSYYPGGVEAQYFVFDAVGATKSVKSKSRKILKSSVKKTIA